MDHIVSYSPLTDGYTQTNSKTNQCQRRKLSIRDPWSCDGLNDVSRWFCKVCTYVLLIQSKLWSWNLCRSMSQSTVHEKSYFLRPLFSRFLARYWTWCKTCQNRIRCTVGRLYPTFPRWGLINKGQTRSCISRTKLRTRQCRGNAGPRVACYIIP